MSLNLQEKVAALEKQGLPKHVFAGLLAEVERVRQQMNPLSRTKNVQFLGSQQRAAHLRYFWPNGARLRILVG